MSAELVFLYVLAFINIILWFVFFLKFRSRFSPEHILTEIRIEVDKLITEISKEADRDISLLEGRIRGLKSLIDEADRHITLSEKEKKQRAAEERTLDRLQSITEVHSVINPVRKIPETLVRENFSVPSRSFSSVPLVPRGSAASLYQKTVTEGTGAEETVRISPQNSSSSGTEDKVIQINAAEYRIKPKVPVRDQIIAFHNTGFTPEMIAERLSLTVSEIELTISLYTS